MDCNKNGKVTSDEFKKLLSRLTNSSITLKNIKQEIKKNNINQKIFVKAQIPPETQYLDFKQF